MFDRISDLFRRVDTAKTTTPKSPARPAAPTPPPVDPAVEAARAQAIADAGRELDGQPSPVAALRIAQAELPADLRCRAIALVDDTAALRAIALGDKVARVRLAAAERLTVEDDLELLRRESGDKAVQRHVRDTLKAMREREQEAKATRERVDHLLLGIAHHAGRAFEPLYDAKLDSLEQAWLPLAAQATAAEQERFAELASLARDTVRRHAAEIAARSAAISAKQELIAACTELETIAGRLAHEALNDSVPAVSALLTTQQTRWQEAASLAQVDAPLARRYDAAAALLDRWLSAAAELPRVAHDASALLEAIAAQPAPDADTLDTWQDALAALRDRLAWPAGVVAPPLLGELEQAHRHLKSLRKAQQADRDQHLAQLHKRRHALKRMIDQGQLRAATRTHQWLEKRIAELPAKDAATERTALAAVAESLKHLHDWYEFASVPKKTALCERMEALSINAPDIAARADQIRELREQWNLLCAADPDADPELRARFDQSAALAWAPCAAWYAEQHRILDANLAKRVALCDALAAEISALDTTAPTTVGEWKALENRERDLRAEWKKHEPVRWPEARAVQERFTTLVAALRVRLDGERRRNAALKQGLVGAARALMSREPIETAITEAKKLQEDWKKVGYTEHRDDRALWQDFRGAVDGVFARRDAARDADRVAREAAAAEAVARQAEETAKREQRVQATRAARQAEIDTALALADAESRWLAGTAVDLVDAATLQAGVDALGKSSLANALRTRCAGLTADARPSPAELAANAEKLAELTLDIEILLELPSPPELAATRMARKVARLNASLRGNKGEAVGSKDADPRRQLVDNWLASGPVAGSERAALLARVRGVLTG